MRWSVRRVRPPGSSAKRCSCSQSANGPLQHLVHDQRRLLEPRDAHEPGLRERQRPLPRAQAAPRSRARAGTCPRPRRRAGPAARCARHCACRDGTRTPAPIGASIVQRARRRSRSMRVLRPRHCVRGPDRADSRRGGRSESPRHGCARASPARASCSTSAPSSVEVGAGTCAISCRPRRELTQQHGYVHAGVVAAIADSAAGYAAMSLMPAGSEVLTVEFKLNLLAPAAGDLLIARGRVLRAGRTLTVCEATVAAPARRRGDAVRRRCSSTMIRRALTACAACGRRPDSET